jgi:hypothetical protein
MQLLKRGLSADRTGKRYIPTFKNRKIFTMDGRGNVVTVPAKKEVTVGNLLT